MNDLSGPLPLCTTVPAPLEEEEIPQKEAAGESDAGAVSLKRKRRSLTLTHPPPSKGRKKCEHGRRRNSCKECGGSQICVHRRVRSKCKGCDGASICQHGRQKVLCKECGGSQICGHRRRRSQCRECGGASICEHGRVRSQCRECGGTSVCDHERRKSKCKECGGGSICDHGRQRSECRECGGASICEHGRQKNKCKKCGGASICKNCTDRHINPKYKPFCGQCYAHLNPDSPVARRFKIKETVIVDALRAAFPGVEMVLDKRVEGPCSSGKRPDIRIERHVFGFLIEVDEHSHMGYTCEGKRVMQLFADLGGRPLVLLRFNPDGYSEPSPFGPGKIKHKSIFTPTATGLATDATELARRMTSLTAAVDKWLKCMDVPEKEITIEELFYST